MTQTSSYPVMEGKYKLTLDINENGFTDPLISNQKTVPVKFVEAVVKHITLQDSQIRRFNIIGYTACKLELDGTEEIFLAPQVMALMGNGMIGASLNGRDMMKHILL
jgi:hypothetical protein